jgi:hypothetical protein
MSPWWPTCHIGARLAICSAWDECFLNETQNVEKMGFDPATPWSLEAYTTRLLLRLCCCASYYLFVLCSGVLIRSTHHARRTGETRSHTRPKFKFKFKFPIMYFKFCPNLNSSLNSIFFEIIPNLA